MDSRVSGQCSHTVQCLYIFCLYDDKTCLCFQDGYCHDDKVQPIVKLSGYVNVTAYDQNALKFAIASKGPVSVAIDASHKSLSFYSDGVYYEPACGKLSNIYDTGTQSRKDTHFICEACVNLVSLSKYCKMKAKLPHNS